MFDEVYHARTAYEMLHRLPIYENTHPPLGKYLMSLGIRIFGMTPFGWRIVAFTSALMIFDFMHFTLSRIGTIDVIVAFFILLTFYLMYLVLEELKKGLSFRVCVLMVLNGVSAGAAMASTFGNPVIWWGGIPALFYPVISGYPVKKAFSGRWLEWLGSWVLS